MSTLGSGKYRFGTAHGDPSRIVHSDTLFSALCRNYRRLYGNRALEGLLEAVISGEFRLSSGFHGLRIHSDPKGDREELGTVYFLPRPRKRLELEEESRERAKKNPKLLEGIRYLSLKAFEKLARGKKLAVSEELIVDEAYLLDEADRSRLGLESPTDGKDLLDRVGLFERVDEQKAVVDRAGGDSDTFLSPKVRAKASRYRAEGHRYLLEPTVYFLLDYGPDLPEKKLLAAVRLIADQGLGGDRSTGNGLFEEVEIAETSRRFSDLIDPDGSGPWMSLSLLFPARNDFKEIESYSLIERTFYIESPDAGGRMGEKIRFLEEGAVCGSRVEGSIEEVSPEGFEKRYHPVYRYGRGLYCSLNVT